MTLNQLSYYIEIVRRNSFTKAAEKLFVSQSTLSKSIRTLEEEFQIELINRAAPECERDAADWDTAHGGGNLFLFRPARVSG